MINESHEKTDAQKSLEQTLSESGLDLPIDFSGQVVRNGSQWFIGKKFDSGIYCAWAGDWARPDIKIDWVSDILDSPEQKAAFSREKQEILESEAKARLDFQEKVAQELLAKIRSFSTTGESKYLVKKKLSQACSAWHYYDGQDLIIPMVILENGEFKTYNFQRILPEKITLKDGSLCDKFYQKGARIKGCFTIAYFYQYTPENLFSSEGHIYICEGYATGLTVSMAVGEKHTVVCAMQANNLPNVAQEMRSAWPNKKIIICADNDQYKPESGNPGVKYATEAAALVRGHVITPVFKDTSSKPTDFNDLYLLEGIEAVQSRLLDAVPGVGDTGSGFGINGNGDAAAKCDTGPGFGVDLLPLTWRQDPKDPKKLKMPSEQDLADHVLRGFGADILKQGKELFLYTGTHWRLFADGEYDRIKMLIQKACSYAGTASKVESIYRLFMYACPGVPNGVDLFVPHPFCANFRNGTLWLVKGSGVSEWRLEFRPHNRTDYLVTVLPLDYSDTPEVNPEFENMLSRIFTVEEKELGTQVVQELLGACLMPAFPHFWMLHGRSKTGKSTVGKIALELVSAANICSVAPSELHGFNMETMPGKLVNYDLDIPFDRPMRDEILKKVIDRKPVRVRRKGIKDLETALLPAVHIFAGNQVPRALDGVSHAHDRRWTFLEFTKVIEEDHGSEYARYCFGVNPKGVLAHALIGLRRLCLSKGKFTELDSGAAKKASWQLHSDPVGMFLEDIKKEGFKPDQGSIVIWGDAVGKRKILTKKAWGVFQEWYRECYCREPRIGKHTFFDTMRGKGYAEHKIGGVHYFVGFGDELYEGAKF